MQNSSFKQLLKSTMKFMLEVEGDLTSLSQATEQQEPEPRL